MELLTIQTLRERSWQWLVRHAQSPHALLWLALVAFTDAIFFPIAPEVFLVALMLAHPSRWKEYLPVSILSSVTGAAVGYYIAAFLFVQFGEPILNFYHLQMAFGVARRLIMGHVFLAMAVASFTPIPDKVFIYAGGFLGVHFTPFITGYFLGRGLRMTLVVYFTGKYGAQVLDLIRNYLLYAGLIVVALLAYYGIVHFHILGF